MKKEKEKEKIKIITSHSKFLNTILIFCIRQWPSSEKCFFVTFSFFIILFEESSFAKSKYKSQLCKHAKYKKILAYGNLLILELRQYNFL